MGAVYLTLIFGLVATVIGCGLIARRDWPNNDLLREQNQKPKRNLK